jgi:hypothetical protein
MNDKQITKKQIALYEAKLNALSNEIWGITAEDLGIDDDLIKRLIADGTKPIDHVEYRGEKLGLTRMDERYFVNYKTQSK